MEEQFYIVFPILLWVLYRFNINIFGSVIVLTVISYLINIRFRSFYMPWTRFWELSIGAVLAYTVNYHCFFLERLRNKVNNNLLLKFFNKADNQKCVITNLISILGLILIIVGYFTITQSPKFPGSRALLPVFGALLIIAAGPDAFINKRILSSKVFVFFGLISFPLYLWHWPLLSFAYIFYDQEPSVLVSVAMVFSSIILAIITFYFVEPKLRYGKYSGFKAIALFIVMVSICIYSFSNLYNKKIFSKVDNKGFHERFYGGIGINYSYEIQKFKHPSSKESIILYGDSFSRQYVPYLRNHANIIGLVRDGNLCFSKYCKTLYEITSSRKFENLMKLLSANLSNNVLIIQRFSSYSNKDCNFSKNMKLISESIEELAENNLNKNFYVVSQPYDIKSSLPEICFLYKNKQINENNYFQKIRFKNLELCKNKGYSINVSSQYNIKRINSKLKEIADKHANLKLIDINKILCKGHYCKSLDDKGFPLYSDKTHFSIWGRDYVGPYILKEMGISN